MAVVTHGQRRRTRTISEQMSLAIDVDGIQRALFYRAQANGDDFDRAVEKMLKALDTPGRWMRLKGKHYFLFLDEWGPEPDAEEQWAAILDEALRDATLRMSN